MAILTLPNNSQTIWHSHLPDEGGNNHSLAVRYNHSLAVRYNHLELAVQNHVPNNSKAIWCSHFLLMFAHHGFSHLLTMSYNYSESLGSHYIPMIHKAFVVAILNPILLTKCPTTIHQQFGTATYNKLWCVIHRPSHAAISNQFLLIMDPVPLDWWRYCGVQRIILCYIHFDK